MRGAIHQIDTEAGERAPGDRQRRTLGPMSALSTCSRTLVAASFLTFAVACGERLPEDPGEEVRKPSPESTAAIETDQTSYVLGEGEFGPETTIVSRLRAIGDQRLHIVNCNGVIGTGLQRQVDDGWVNAWVGASNSCLSPPITVEPGGDHVEPMIIRRGAGAVLHPPGHGDQLEPGTYRVVWFGVLTSYEPTSRSFGEEVPLEQRVSGPIEITTASERMRTADPRPEP